MSYLASYHLMLKLWEGSGIVVYACQYVFVMCFFVQLTSLSFVQLLWGTRLTLVCIYAIDICAYIHAHISGSDLFI